MLVGYAMLSGVADAADPVLPDKPAGLWGRDGSDCRNFGYVEGPRHCDWLEGLGEPTWPVSDGASTKLAIRMIWGVGDRNPSVTLRFEIRQTNLAIMRIYEGVEARRLWLEGMTSLEPDEIRQLLAAGQKADIWSKPYELPPAKQPSPPKNGGIEIVMVCYDYLTIAEVREGKSKVVEGACADPVPNKDVLAYARTMMRIAQHHFPDFARTQLWQDELKSN